MNKFAFALLVMILAASCGAARVTPSVTDSTRVEVRIEKEYVVDTAFIELPVIVDRLVTLDTASVIENKYAKSAASVSGGVLTHSLETKPFKQPIEYKKEIVYRDSLVFRDRVETQTVEVEKKLNLLQCCWLALGSVIMWMLIAWIVYTIIRFIVSLNLFKK